MCQGRDSLRFEQRLCQPRGVRPLLFRGVHLDLLLDLHRRRQWRRVKLAHGMRLQDVHVQHGEPVSRIRQIDTWGSGFRLSQSGVNAAALRVWEVAGSPANVRQMGQVRESKRTATCAAPFAAPSALTSASRDVGFPASVRAGPSGATLPLAGALDVKLLRFYGRIFW